MFCKKGLLIVFIVTGIISLWKNSYGELTVHSSYPTTAPKLERRTIGIEIFEYEVLYYSPPIKISIKTSRTGARYDIPEAATISFISSIVANDFDWWFDSFDELQKKELLGSKRADYEEMKNYELKETSDKYKNKSIELLTYIRYQDYVLIDWMAYNHDGTKAFRMLTPLKFENGMWKVTADPNPASFLIFKWN